eukprot:1180993-Prorocentrum_minimum.AAC.5
MRELKRRLSKNRIIGTFRVRRVVTTTVGRLQQGNAVQLWSSCWSTCSGWQFPPTRTSKRATRPKLRQLAILVCELDMTCGIASQEKGILRKGPLTQSDSLSLR